MPWPESLIELEMSECLFGLKRFLDYEEMVHLVLMDLMFERRM